MYMKIAVRESKFYKPRHGVEPEPVHTERNSHVRFAQPDVEETHAPMSPGLIAQTDDAIVAKLREDGLSVRTSPAALGWLAARVPLCGGSMRFLARSASCYIWACG